MSAILSLKWLPKKPAGKPETAVFFSEKPETAGFPKSQDCPQPSSNRIKTGKVTASSAFHVRIREGEYRDALQGGPKVV